MWCKNGIYVFVLLVFLSCSPDQEVLENDPFAEGKENFYEILDLNEFRTEDRETIQNLGNYRFSEDGEILYEILDIKEFRPQDLRTIESLNNCPLSEKQLNMER